MRRDRTARLREPKDRGVWVELLFMARGTEEALGMSRPWGDARWDVG